jgi:hydroxyacyl-ACP dehydratase HTD2-like protein with hotdog domain
MEYGEFPSDAWIWTCRFDQKPANMTDLLTPELLSNIGKSAAPVMELVSRRDIRKYSVATQQRLEKFLLGNEAPPLFHVALFWDVVEQDQLSEDGLSTDGLLPEFPLKRAMAGGWKIKYHQPIYPGDELVSSRTLTNIFQKQGSSGPLIFYQLLNEITTSSGEPVVTENITRILR